MSARTPRDGEPFYCIHCGAGFAEYGACELVECQLESQAEARARMPDEKRERVLRQARAS